MVQVYIHAVMLSLEAETNSFYACHSVLGKSLRGRGCRRVGVPPVAIHSGLHGGFQRRYSFVAGLEYHLTQFSVVCMADFNMGKFLAM